jgi:hypothetical protein
MDYGRALKFPFSDSSWLSKVLIGVLLALVPVANLASYGYGVEVTRRVASADREELPAWDQFGRYFVRGFALTVASLLYMLPGLLAFLVLLLLFNGSPAMIGLSGFLLVAYLLLVALAFPVALVRYALTDEWFTMFDFSWVLRFLGGNLGTYVVMLLVIALLAALLSALGMLALGIGIYVTSYWILLMTHHLLGQLVRRSAVV